MILKALFTFVHVVFLVLIMMSLHRIFKGNQSIKVDYMSKTFKLYRIQSYSGIMVILGVLLLLRMASKSDDLEKTLTQFYNAGMLLYILLYVSTWLMSPKNFVVAKEGLYYRHRFGPLKRICDSSALQDYMFDDKNRLRIKYTYKNKQVVDIRISGQYSESEIKIIAKALKTMEKKEKKKT